MHHQLANPLKGNAYAVPCSAFSGFFFKTRTAFNAEGVTCFTLRLVQSHNYTVALKTGIHGILKENDNRAPSSSRSNREDAFVPRIGTMFRHLLRVTGAPLHSSNNSPFTSWLFAHPPQQQRSHH